MALNIKFFIVIVAFVAVFPTGNATVSDVVTEIVSGFHLFIRNFYYKNFVVINLLIYGIYSIYLRKLFLFRLKVTTE